MRIRQISKVPCSVENFVLLSEYVFNLLEGLYHHQDQFKIVSRKMMRKLIPQKCNHRHAFVLSSYFFKEYKICETKINSSLENSTGIQ